eukprot:Nk52_evm67s223 gene=Nk52_evmTU67s223
MDSHSRLSHISSGGAGGLLDPSLKKNTLVKQDIKPIPVKPSQVRAHLISSTRKSSTASLAPMQPSSDSKVDSHKSPVLLQKRHALQVSANSSKGKKVIDDDVDEERLANFMKRAMSESQRMANIAVKSRESRRAKASNQARFYTIKKDNAATGSQNSQNVASSSRMVLELSTGQGAVGKTDSSCSLEYVEDAKHMDISA